MYCPLICSSISRMWLQGVAALEPSVDSDTVNCEKLAVEAGGKQERLHGSRQTMKSVCKPGGDITLSVSHKDKKSSGAGHRSFY